jgi:hypothetical protein
VFFNPKQNCQLNHHGHLVSHNKVVQKEWLVESMTSVKISAFVIVRKISSSRKLSSCMPCTCFCINILVIPCVLPPFVFPFRMFLLDSFDNLTQPSRTKFIMVNFQTTLAARGALAVLALVPPVFLTGCSTRNDINKVIYSEPSDAQNSHDSEELEATNAIAGNIVRHDVDGVGDPTDDVPGIKGPYTNNDGARSFRAQTHWHIPNNLMFTYKKILIDAPGVTKGDWRTGVVGNRDFTVASDPNMTKEERLLANNVLKTIKKYRDESTSWGNGLQPVQRVFFYDDALCRDALQKEEQTQLLTIFDNEQQGMYKGDICRIAMLHRFGGFYFDVDLETREPVYKLMNANTHFSTIRESSMNGETSLKPNGVFFQAFIASAPRHNILKNAYDAMRTWLKKNDLSKS